MTDDIRMGIIGPGVIAPSHAFAINKARGARLAAVCGRRLEPTAELADQYGAEPVTDIAALLDRERQLHVRVGERRLELRVLRLEQLLRLRHPRRELLALRRPLRPLARLKPLSLRRAGEPRSLLLGLPARSCCEW